MTAFIQPETFTHIPGNVWVYWKDTQGVLKGCNNVMAEALGLSSPTEIVGLSDFDLMKRKDADFYRQSDKSVIKQKTSMHFKEPVSLENKNIQCLSIKSPLINEKLEIVGVMGISYFDSFSSNEYTHRENTIINLTIKGYTAKKISAQLFLSRRTVEHYLENIKSKMQVKTKSELIEKAIQLFTHPI